MSQAGGVEAVDPGAGVAEALSSVSEVVNDHLGVVLILGGLLLVDKWLDRWMRQQAKLARTRERAERRAAGRQEARNERFREQTAYSYSVFGKRRG